MCATMPALADLSRADHRVTELRVCMACPMCHRDVFDLEQSTAALTVPNASVRDHAEVNAVPSSDLKTKGGHAHRRADELDSRNVIGSL